MLEPKQKTPIDPVIEDLKQEHERKRNQPLIQKPEVVEKQKRLEARQAAADIVNSYPMDSNTYGKTKLATIEKI